MQTEVGLFIFHVNLPGRCLLLCQFPHLFTTIFFSLGIHLDHLLKGQCTRPLHALSVERIYIYFFLSRCFIDINFINLLWREICSEVICQLFNKKKWQCLAIRQHFSNCIFCILQIQGSQTMGKQNLCLVQIRMLLYQVCLLFQLTCLI